MLKEKIKGLFGEVKRELYNPPITLSEISLKEKSDVISLEIRKGLLNVRLGEKFLERGDWEDTFKWLLRHYLSHIHYCPYDLRTAYELERTAFKVLRSWKLAHFALRLFAECMVDLVYLPYRFLEVPGHLSYIFRKKPEGLDLLIYAAYRAFYGDHVPEHEIDTIIEGYGKDILNVVHSPKPWFFKQRLIASIIGRTIVIKKKLMKKLYLTRHRLHESFPGYLPIIEDVKGIDRSGMESIYGEIKEEEEAKSFYENWLKPRLGKEEEETAKKLKKTIVIKGKSKVKAPKKLSEKELKVYGGEEPPLPTTLSKPLSKIKKKLLEEGFWRRHWYKARARRVLVEYALRSRIKRVRFQEYSYPEEWHVEDDIEDLDIELSTTEGPLIPEITTAKWVPKRLEFGTLTVTCPVPSLLIVLDSSRSMLSAFNNAATAAFILYLSAKQAGSEVATVNFSTKYMAADWSAEDAIKETVLSVKMGEYTIFPYPELEKILRKAPSETLVTVITDGGWQNFGEALKWLEERRKQGLGIVIFHLYGWKYDRNIKIMKERAGLNVIRVDNPEKDLNRLVLGETKKTYGFGIYYQWP